MHAVYVSSQFKRLAVSPQLLRAVFLCCVAYDVTPVWVAYWTRVKYKADLLTSAENDYLISEHAAPKNDDLLYVLPLDSFFPRLLLIYVLSLNSTLIVLRFGADYSVPCLTMHCCHCDHRNPPPMYRTYPGGNRPQRT